MVHLHRRAGVLIIMPIAHRTIGTKPAWSQAGRPWFWHLYSTALPGLQWRHGWAPVSQRGAFEPFDPFAATTPTLVPIPGQTAGNLISAAVDLTGLTFDSGGVSPVAHTLLHAVGGAVITSLPGGSRRMIIGIPAELDRVPVYIETAEGSGHFSLASLGGAAMSWNKPAGPADAPLLGFDSAVNPSIAVVWSAYNFMDIVRFNHSIAGSTTPNWISGRSLQIASSSTAKYVLPAFRTGGISFRPSVRTSIGLPNTQEIMASEIVDVGSYEGDPSPNFTAQAIGMTGNFHQTPAINSALNGLVESLIGPVADQYVAGRTYYICHRRTNVAFPSASNFRVSLCRSDNGTTYSEERWVDYTYGSPAPERQGFLFADDAGDRPTVAVLTARVGHIRAVLSLRRRFAEDGAAIGYG